MFTRLRFCSTFYSTWKALYWALVCVVKVSKMYRSVITLVRWEDVFWLFIRQHFMQYNNRLICCNKEANHWSETDKTGMKNTIMVIKISMESIRITTNEKTSWKNKVCPPWISRFYLVTISLCSAFSSTGCSKSLHA